MNRLNKIQDKYDTELEQWRRHKNWDNTAGQLYYFHSHFRQESKRLLKTPDLRNFQNLCHGLHGHHMIEGKYY
jgi:hypothetical protein